MDENVEEGARKAVYMWGYLPGVTPEKSPILSPAPVSFPAPESCTDVCCGGCGFAMAVSESGKLVTWGSADDEEQIYLTSGKHGETPGAFPLPSESLVVMAAAGWAHCILATERGEVYAWGWKECVPSGQSSRDYLAMGGSVPKDASRKQPALLTEQATAGSRGSGLMSGAASPVDNRNAGEETTKKRRVSLVKEDSESSSPGDEFFTALPSLVNFGPGVRITSVAAGGRHTLVLSGKPVGLIPPATDVTAIKGKGVWGWGYGGEGQLGLGSRIKMVSSPHLIPCIELSTPGKDRPLAVYHGSLSSTAPDGSMVLGNYIKEIACGGRHSAVITDNGALLTFGWGLYGQCGQGSTNDQLRPSSVSSLLGVQVASVAAGLWHTVCVATNGCVYVFGGNQFGQLGTGADQAETQPRLLDAPGLENKRALVVSCGVRHSAILTDDGEIYSWGWNKYGQLGLGDAIDRNVPSKVMIDSCRPTKIACGWWHTLLLAEVTQ